MQGPDEECHDGIGVDDVFLCEKFKRAFDIPLVNNASEDNAGDHMEICWLRWGAVSLKGKQFK